MNIKKLKEPSLTRRQLLGSTAAALLPQSLSISRGPVSIAGGEIGQRQKKAKTFSFPSIGMKVESQAVLLAIDHSLLPLRRNLCYYPSKPKVRKEPVLTPSQDKPDAPDFMAADHYGSVLFDNGKYRMWYLGSQSGSDKLGSAFVSYLCYAESEDGISWTKPALGQVPIKGNRNNNAIFIPDSRTEGVTLIKDDDDPDPKRRYKMIYQRYHDKKISWTIRTATSSNGIDKWIFGPELPIASFVEFSSLYKHDGLYILNAQTVSPHWRSEGGHKMGRQGLAWVSPDFEHWLQEAAESFFVREPENPEGRGASMHYDQNHLGTGAVSYGNVLVGLYCVWHPRGKGEDWFGLGTTSGDFSLVVGNDGLHFREPVKGHIYLASEESPATPAKDGDYPTILCQGNSILNVGEETRIYHGRWLNMKSTSEWYGEVALATLPRDRWGALGLFPDQSEGSIWTSPITLPADGCQIALNADDAAGMRIEIADERFNPLPPYSSANSGQVQMRQGFECPVKWKGNLQSLAGNTVRLRIHFKRQEQSPNPRLYALYLK